MMNKGLKRLLWSTALLFLSIGSGLVGYHLIEGYTFSEAFYMTVITISTVGFEEVRELSANGRMFTSIYILFNIGIFVYYFTTLSRFLFEGEFREMFSNYMTSRDIRKLKDHVIVCGYGRNGYEACKQLKEDGVDYVIIDQNMDVVVQHHGEDHDLNVIPGDATDEKILKNAGVEFAKAIIAAVPRDSTNVFIALTARELNPGIKIIARGTRTSAESKLIRAGVDNVVMPDSIGGRYMATLVNKPEVIEFLEMINGVGEVKLSLEEVSYDDFKTPFKGKSIAEMNVREKCGVTFLGFKSISEGYQFNPNSHTILKPGEVFICLGTTDEIDIFINEYTVLNAK